MKLRNFEEKDYSRKKQEIEEVKIPNKKNNGKKINKVDFIETQDALE